MECLSRCKSDLISREITTDCTLLVFTLNEPAKLRAKFLWVIISAPVSLILMFNKKRNALNLRRTGDLASA